MGMVLINIGAMADYVAALESAIATSRWAATDLQAKCSQADLWDPDCASFMDGESTVELEAVLTDVRQRLELALLVAASTMSFGGFTGDLPPVSIDSEQFESFEKGQEWADKVDAGTMTEADWAALEEALTASWGQWTAAGLFGSVSPQALADTLASQVQATQSVPRWLVTAVLVCQGDPGCEDTVTRVFPPDILGPFLTQIHAVQADRAYWGNPSVEDFLAEENVLLYGLAGCLSGSVSRMGADALGGYEAVWASTVQNALFGTADVPMLGLVVGRGQWPSSFLTNFADEISRMESDAGTGSAAWRPIAGDVLDPDIDFQSGGHLVSNDPMSGVFRSAALYDPHWFLDRYTGGGTVSVEVGYPVPPMPGMPQVPGSYPVDVDEALYGLFLRDLDAGSLVWFQQVIGMAALSDPMRVEGLLADIGNIVGSIKYAAAQWEKLSWWEKYHHQVLGLGAFVLGIAAIAVPGPGWTAGLLVLSNATVLADAGYYWAEGHQVAAGLEIALVAVPFMIGGIVKWVRLSASEFRALRLGESVVLADGVRLTPQAVADTRFVTAAMRPRGYFVPELRGVPTWADVQIAASIDAGGNLSASSAEAIGRLATMNPESPYVVLGTFADDSVKSYEQIGFLSSATYYDVGEAYDLLKARLIARGLTEEQASAQLWKINEAFLQEQVTQGKTFYFTVNPTDTSIVKVGSGTYNEWAYLEANGYQLESFGSYWKAVK